MDIETEGKRRRKIGCTCETKSNTKRNTQDEKEIE